jgi:pentalenolactone synthase
MTQTQQDLLVLPFTDGRNVLDFSPTYRRLQEEAPVAQVRTPAGDVGWLVTRYDDVKALVADRRLGRSHPDPAHAARFTTAALAGGPIMDYATEEVEHAAVRKLASRPFTARRLRSLPALVEKIAVALLDDVASMTPPVDLNAKFSGPLPVLVICALLGVPTADRAMFVPWAKGLLSSQDSERAMSGLANLTNYMRQLIAEKRKSPGDDILSELIAIKDKDDPISEDMLVLMALALLVAGHLSTTSRIDYGALLFLENPDQLAALARDPQLLPNAIEEIVRLATPGGEIVLRYARTDIELHGVRIEAGDLVLSDLSAANRDERVFSDPLRFDITRTPNPHLGFGHGWAYCLGAGLGRVNLSGSLRALFQRFPTLELAVPLESIERSTDFQLGSLVALPMTW